MGNDLSSYIGLPEFPLWQEFSTGVKLYSFELELTARCNNNCRHCYICLPPDDWKARRRELTPGQIERIAAQAASLGALWCLITGGEPLLREDFADIYLRLKRAGLLVSVFTNASLVTREHVELFRKYPPRDIEVTVYGVTRATYERVSGVPGSFAAFMRGLSLLLDNGIRTRLKAVVTRSNVKELPAIARFCRERTVDYFRFDPLLHLRLDRDTARNRLIRQERLSPSEIAVVEAADGERSEHLRKKCDSLLRPGHAEKGCSHLFHCGTGNSGFTVGPDGILRLCSTLCHPDCVYDLKKGKLAEALGGFAASVRSMRSRRREFLAKCHNCQLVNLCHWCPATAYLETGKLDSRVDYFCRTARAREKILRKSRGRAGEKNG
ncbi:MAG: radical SAM protein [Deltaproteobacteria bacterium]